MEDRIKSFLEETFLFDFGGEIAGDTDLFKAGVMDSFGYVQLVGYLKTEFGIVFTDEEMLTNILVSLDRIVAFVRARRGGAVSMERG